MGKDDIFKKLQKEAQESAKRQQELLHQRETFFQNNNKIKQDIQVEQDSAESLLYKSNKEFILLTNQHRWQMQRMGECLMDKTRRVFLKQQKFKEKEKMNEKKKLQSNNDSNNSIDVSLKAADVIDIKDKDDLNNVNNSNDADDLFDFMSMNDKRVSSLSRVITPNILPFFLDRSADVPSFDLGKDGSNNDCDDPTQNTATNLKRYQDINLFLLQDGRMDMGEVEVAHYQRAWTDDDAWYTHLLNAARSSNPNIDTEKAVLNNKNICIYITNLQTLFGSYEPPPWYMFPLPGLESDANGRPSKLLKEINNTLFLYNNRNTYTALLQLLSEGKESMIFVTWINEVCKYEYFFELFSRRIRKGEDLSRYEILGGIKVANAIYFLNIAIDNNNHDDVFIRLKNNCLRLYGLQKSQSRRYHYYLKELKLRLNRNLRSVDIQKVITPPIIFKGTMLPIVLSETAIVNDILDEINSAWGLKSNMNLICNSMKLKSEKKISDYNIYNGVTIYLDMNDYNIYNKEKEIQENKISCNIILNFVSSVLDEWSIRRFRHGQNPATHAWSHYHQKWILKSDLYGNNSSNPSPTPTAIVASPSAVSSSLNKNRNDPKVPILTSSLTSSAEDQYLLLDQDSPLCNPDYGIYFINDNDSNSNNENQAVMVNIHKDDLLKYLMLEGLLSRDKMMPVRLKPRRTLHDANVDSHQHSRIGHSNDTNSFTNGMDDDLINLLSINKGLSTEQKQRLEWLNLRELESKGWMRYYYLTASWDRMDIEAMRMKLRKEIKPPASRDPREIIRMPFATEDQFISKFRCCHRHAERIQSCFYRKGFERHLILGNIIKKRVIPALGNLLKSLHIFPLHDPKTIQYLRAHWVCRFQLIINQPLTEIKDYFGEEIGWYFAWVQFYTNALIFPALLGIGLSIYQGYLLFYLKQSYTQVLNNVGVPLYSILVVLWSSIYLKFWTRRSHAIKLEWGVHNLEEEEIERPEWEWSLREDPVTGEIERYSSASYRLLKRYLITFPILIVYLAACTYSFFFIAENYNYILDGFFVAILNAVLMIIEKVIYWQLVAWLTKWENIKTLKKYNNHFIIRVFLFEFIISNMPLYSTAILSSNDQKLKQIYVNLVTLFISQIFVSNFVEFCSPFILKRLGWLRIDPRILLENEFDVARQQKMPQYLDTDYMLEYVKIIRQFCYVTLFSSACPIAPVLALLNNYVEVRQDGGKLVHHYQRPYVCRSDGIGVWHFCMELISFLSIVTNLALIYFSFTFLQDSNSGNSLIIPGATILIDVVIIEHIMVILFLAIHFLIPDIPNVTRRKMRLEDSNAWQVMFTNETKSHNNNSNKTKNVGVDDLRTFVRVTVHGIRARDLRRDGRVKGATTRTDPYCVITLDNNKALTKLAKNDRHPNWFYESPKIFTLSMGILDWVANDRYLNVTLYNYNKKLMADDIIGSMNLNLRKRQFGRLIEDRPLRRILFGEVFEESGAIEFHLGVEQLGTTTVILDVVTVKEIPNSYLFTSIDACYLKILISNQFSKNKSYESESIVYICDDVLNTFTPFWPHVRPLRIQATLNELLKLVMTVELHKCNDKVGIAGIGNQHRNMNDDVVIARAMIPLEKYIIGESDGASPFLETLYAPDSTTMQNIPLSSLMEDSQNINFETIYIDGKLSETPEFFPRDEAMIPPSYITDEMISDGDAYNLDSYANNKNNSDEIEVNEINKAGQNPDSELSNLVYNLKYMPAEVPLFNHQVGTIEGVLTYFNMPKASLIVDACDQQRLENAGKL